MEWSPYSTPERQGEDGDGANRGNDDPEEQQKPTLGGWSSLDGEEEEEGIRDAFDRLDRQSTVLVRETLLKAEDSLLQQKDDEQDEIAAATGQDAGQSQIVTSQEQETPGGAGEDADDEADFWLAYKAQQREAEAKAALKDQKFTKEWSTPFIHLRAQGTSLRNPAVKEKEKEKEAKERPGEMRQGAAWFPPPSSIGVHSNEREGNVIGNGMIVAGNRTKIWTHQAEDMQHEAVGEEEEEVIASHGQVEEILAYDRQPTLGGRRQNGDMMMQEGADPDLLALMERCRIKEEQKRRAAFNEVANPAHVIANELAMDLAEEIWADVLTKLEGPLTRLLQRELCQKKQGGEGGGRGQKLLSPQSRADNDDDKNNDMMIINEDRPLAKKNKRLYGSSAASPGEVTSSFLSAAAFSSPSSSGLLPQQQEEGEGEEEAVDSSKECKKYRQSPVEEEKQGAFPIVTSNTGNITALIDDGMKG